MKDQHAVLRKEEGGRYGTEGVERGVKGGRKRDRVNFFLYTSVAQYRLQKGASRLVRSSGTSLSCPLLMLPLPPSQLSVYRLSFSISSLFATEHDEHQRQGQQIRYKIWKCCQTSKFFICPVLVELGRLSLICALSLLVLVIIGKVRERVRFAVVCAGTPFPSSVSSSYLLLCSFLFLLLRSPST